MDIPSSYRELKLSRSQLLVKRIFDIVLSFLGLLFLGWLILLAWIFASIDTRSNGFFVQTRVGLKGKTFKIYKIKTMIPSSDSFETTVICSDNPRITWLGNILRKAKIDELPQLWNILKGDMSFVGPRPDVPGFADKLEGHKRAVLMVRPGVTGPATLKYKYEGEILASVPDPEKYNKNVIWPDKVRLNLEYIQNWSLLLDVKYLIKTVLS